MNTQMDEEIDQVGGYDGDEAEEELEEQDESDTVEEPIEGMEEPTEGVEEELVEEEPIEEEEIDGSDVNELRKVVEYHRSRIETVRIRPIHRLTKYEYTALIGFRAQQIAEGAPPYVKVVEGMDAISIAQKELDENLIPLLPERPYPTNKINMSKYVPVRLGDLVNIMPH